MLGFGRRVSRSFRMERFRTVAKIIVSLRVERCLTRERPIPRLVPVTSQYSGIKGEASTV